MNISLDYMVVLSGLVPIPTRSATDRHCAAPMNTTGNVAGVALAGIKIFPLFVTQPMARKCDGLSKLCKRKRLLCNPLSIAGYVIRTRVFVLPVRYRD